LESTIVHAGIVVQAKQQPLVGFQKGFDSTFRHSKQNERSNHTRRRLPTQSLFYVRHLEAVKKSITVRELADEYLEFQKSYNRSEVHRRDLRGRFNRFCLIWGPSPSRSHFYRNQEMVVRDERRTQNF
jgi:hypothetical protein